MTRMVNRGRLRPTILVFLFVAGAFNYVDNPARILDEADRLAMLSNFSEAASLFHEAETQSRLSGDEKAPLAARLGLARDELDGVIGMVLSRLDVSISRLLQRAPHDVA